MYLLLNCSYARPSLATPSTPKDDSGCSITAQSAVRSQCKIYVHLWQRCKRCTGIIGIGSLRAAAQCRMPVAVLVRE